MQVYIYVCVYIYIYILYLCISLLPSLSLTISMPKTLSASMSVLASILHKYKHAYMYAHKFMQLRCTTRPAVREDDRWSLRQPCWKGLACNCRITSLSIENGYNVSSRQLSTCHSIGGSCESSEWEILCCARGAVETQKPDHLNSKAYNPSS